MQSVDESYEFVSLEADNGTVSSDRRHDDELDSERLEHIEHAEHAQQQEQVPRPEHVSRPEHVPRTEHEQNRKEPDPSETVFDYYPPHPLRELGEENGIHYFEDGHFYTEVISIILFYDVELGV